MHALNAAALRAVEPVDFMLFYFFFLLSPQLGKES